MDGQNSTDLKEKGKNGGEKELMKNKNLKIILIIAATMAIVVIAIVVIKLQLGKEQNSNKEVITVSTLEKIINVSELSTFEAVYNGVSKIMNEKKPDKIDYYVSYEARVYAGLDIKDIQITKDEESKKIMVIIPPIEITEINVDITSLDYIFINDKANTSTVSEQAYKACIADVTEESEKEDEIFDLAEQNAKNIIKALISPFIEQLDSDYELVIN